MIFKIKEIGDGGLALNLPISAAWLASECPDLDAIPAGRGLKLRGQLLRSGDDIFLRGTLRGALETVCSRCLEKAQIPLDVSLTVTFRPQPEGAEAIDDDEEAEEEEELDVASYDGEEIDLGPEVRDQILLALPLKALCREDCLGLCSVCGGDRNEIPCDCASRQGENRTPLAAVLGKLKI